MLKRLLLKSFQKFGSDESKISSGQLKLLAIIFGLIRLKFDDYFTPLLDKLNRWNLAGSFAAILGLIINFGNVSEYFGPLSYKSFVIFQFLSIMFGLASVVFRHVVLFMDKIFEDNKDVICKLMEDLKTGEVNLSTPVSSGEAGIIVDGLTYPFRKHFFILLQLFFSLLSIIGFLTEILIY
jgi:multisubunit Na+/H+ antiporter MnhG subunit